MGGLFFYSLFGLTVRSDVPFGDYFPRSEPGLSTDVEVRLGDFDVAADSTPGYTEAEGGTLLTVPGVARFLIQNGRRILAAPEPDASERTFRVYLLGSAFGALLHQRGLLPLHANAIDLGGRAIAFSGHSGAGKSTLAAWFHDRGHRVLSDDVCVIDFDTDGTPIAYPGIPRLRLWREALEASGRAAGDYDRSSDRTDKFDVPTGTGRALPPIRLTGIYLLSQASQDSPGLMIERISGVEAVDAIVTNTYRGGYLRQIGGTGRHLLQCTRLARKLPVFRASRLWGFEAFDEQAARLERHARGY